MRLFKNLCKYFFLLLLLDIWNFVCERSSLSAHPRSEVTRIRYLQLWLKSRLLFLVIPWFMSLSDVNDAWRLHPAHPLLSLFFWPNSYARFPGESKFNVQCVKGECSQFCAGFSVLCIRGTASTPAFQWPSLMPMRYTGARGCWERGTCHRQPANAKSLARNARLRLPMRALLRTGREKKSQGKDLLHF